MKTSQFSIKFGLILFCLLVQIPIFVVLHSAVASTALKNNKAVRENLISPDPESDKLSQLIHFAYSCETFSLMGNSPPKAEYRVDISCSFGQPIRLDIEVYRANVNSTTNNGMLLHSTNHTPFTSWWASFSNLNW